MKRLFLGSILVALSASSLASFTYVDFSSTAGLTLNGSATQVGNSIRLSPVTSGTGTVFHNASQGVLGGFTTTWNSRHFDGSGADGISFVLTTSPVTSLGSGGSGNGTQGILNSVAINFRTFWQDVRFEVTDGSGAFTSDLMLGNWTTGRSNAGWTGEIIYDSSGNWTVKQDGNTLVSNYLAPLNTYFSSDVNVGFGSSTGGATDNNDLRSWSFNAVPEPASMAAITLGLAGLVARRKRKA